RPRARRALSRRAQRARAAGARPESAADLRGFRPMSMSTQISRIGVVGAGFMGSGIAESCAVAGVDVTAYEPEQAPLDRSRGRLEQSIGRAVTRGKLTREDADVVIGRIAYTTNLADLDGVDAVIEAVVEDPRVKGKLFARLGRRLP